MAYFFFLPIQSLLFVVKVSPVGTAIKTYSNVHLLVWLAGVNGRRTGLILNRAALVTEQMCCCVRTQNEAAQPPILALFS